MPNWCSNELIIEGKPKELSRLMKQVEITKSEATDEHYESVFACHRVIPRPVNESDNWYNWNIENWGSKWDLSDPRLDNSEWENGVIRYTFESAWSPVIPVVQALAKEHKKVTITYNYYEGGSDFWGEVEYQKGKETSFDEGALSDASCERLEYLMGQHHNCQECWNEIECNGETTQQLCSECEALVEEEDKKLWEREDNDKGDTVVATLQSV